MMAKSHRKGKRRSVAVAFLLSGDGEQNVLTEKELEKKRQEAKAQIEKDWEEATELGGDADDVFCFPLGLSQGDISPEIPLGLYAQTEHGQRPHPWKKGKSNCDFLLDELERLLKRAEDGEEIRIWYAPYNSESLCGLYWFLWQLKQRELHPKVWLMALPERESRPDGVMVEQRGWGEISPYEYGRYLSLQKEMSEAFFTIAQMIWSRLKEENAPLRVLLGATLQSAPEDFYDSIIRYAIQKERGEFRECDLIGRLLGFCLGSCIGYEWLHQRIEIMVRNGELEAVTDNSEEYPIYDRILKRKDS